MAALNSDKCIGEVINIGNNYEISIGDTASIIAELIGRDVKITTDNQRLRPEKSEVERLLASNDKARELLGWQPSYAGQDGFLRGLKETITWFSDKKNLSLYKTDIYNL